MLPNVRCLQDYNIEPNEFVAYTTVQGLKPTVLDSGLLYVQIEIDTINIDDNAVTKLLCKATDMILIRPGDELTIYKPWRDEDEYCIHSHNVSRDNRRKRLSLPKNCPECDHKLIKFFDKRSYWDYEYFERDDRVFCTNSSCSSLSKGIIKRWWVWEELNSELNFSEEFIDTLIEKHSITSICDVYKLRVEDFSLDGQLEFSSAEYVYSVLQASKKAPLWQFLYGLGIPYLSRKNSKLLADKFTSISRINKASLSELRELNLGNWKWEYRSAPSLYQWLNIPANRELISRLMELGFQAEYSTQTKGNMISEIETYEEKTFEEQNLDEAKLEKIESLILNLEKILRVVDFYNDLDSKITENQHQLRGWIDDLKKSLTSNNSGQEDWEREFKSLKVFLEERLVSSESLAKEVSEEIQKQNLFSSLQSIIDEFSKIGSASENLELIQQKLRAIESGVKSLPTQDIIVTLLNLRHSEMVGKLENIEALNASLSKLSLLDGLLEKQAESDSHNLEINTSLSQVKEVTNLINNNVSKMESYLEELTGREHQSLIEIQNGSQILSEQNSIITAELSEIKKAILNGNQNTAQLQSQLESILSENCKLHGEIARASEQNLSLQSTLNERTNLLDKANSQVKVLQELLSLELEQTLAQLSQASGDGNENDQIELDSLTSKLVEMQASVCQNQINSSQVIEGLMLEKINLQKQLSDNEILQVQALSERDSIQFSLREVQAQLQQCQQQNLCIAQEKLNLQSELANQKNQFQQQLHSNEEELRQVSQKLKQSEDNCESLRQEKRNLDDKLKELADQNSSLQKQLEDQKVVWPELLNTFIQKEKDAQKKLMRYFQSLGKK